MADQTKSTKEKGCKDTANTSKVIIEKEDVYGPSKDRSQGSKNAAQDVVNEIIKKCELCNIWLGKDEGKMCETCKEIDGKFNSFQFPGQEELMKFAKQSEAGGSVPKK